MSMTSTARAADTAPVSRTPGRVGGAAALVFVALALLGNSLTGGGVATGAGPGAYAAEAVRRVADPAWRAGIALELVAFVALLVFAAALARRVRSAEPREGYASGLVLAGGVLFSAVKLSSGAALYAADRRAGEMDAGVARLLADLNDSAFVLSFVPLGVLLGGAAVASLAYGALPRALGWSAALLSVLLVAAAAGGADAFPVPFLLSLLWLAAAGVVMVRRPVENAL